MVDTYEMTLSLNVLRHLGISLYSSNPAVLSEAVANAWDADANTVQITIDRTAGQVVVQDDGDGMTRAEVNSRYLRVGYERRKTPGGAKTTSGRAVMGRKGIGKLALFSIARTIQVETVRNGEQSAFELSLDVIESIMGGKDPNASQTYMPRTMPTDKIDFASGTRITLTNLTKGLDQTASNLKRRLARRFTVIDDAFTVEINGTPVTAADRDFSPSVQYIWVYGSPDQQSAMKKRAVKAVHREERVRPISVDNGMTGWIGTAFESGALTDTDSGESLNKLPLIIRGKLALENILDSIPEVGVYQNYLVGEIHADYLDADDLEDIATSSRQSIREDDPRFQALRKFIGAELKHIKQNWTSLRNQGGMNAALDIPEILDWYRTIGADHKRRAERLFGKINQLGLPSRDRDELFAQGVLAFEVMKQRENLDALDDLGPSDLQAIAKVFKHSSQLEEVMYHRIVQQRLAVINKMSEMVIAGELEKYLQQHLFDHLWLLDPGWERASLPTMEISMKSAFAEIADSLPKDEQDSRLDIRYQKTSEQHVIVELKRANVVTDTDTLQRQIRKYRNALLQWLDHNGRSGEAVAVVCVVNKPLRDWKEFDGKKTSAESLRAYGTRVLMYDELLSTAQTAYDDYLRKSDEASNIQKVLDALTVKVHHTEGANDLANSHAEVPIKVPVPAS
jgi:hypothetical protein